MDRNSQPTPAEIELAEFICALHGYVAVPAEVGAICDRLKADPASVTSEEMAAVEYAFASSPYHEHRLAVQEGRVGVDYLASWREGTGGGPSYEEVLTPFLHHQKRPK